jgi:hypothetical protein
MNHKEVEYEYLEMRNVKGGKEEYEIEEKLRRMK